MNIAQSIMSYYDTEDFKGNYWEGLLEDNYACIERIQKAATGYEFHEQYGFNLHLTFEQAEEVLEHMRLNMEDFVSPMVNYFVGYTSIDSVSFGEQEEQLTGLYNHKTGKNYDLKYLKKVFDAEGYVVNGDYAYMDLSGSGLSIDLLVGDLDEMMNKFKEQNA